MFSSLIVDTAHSAIEALRAGGAYVAGGVQPGQPDPASHTAKPWTRSADAADESSNEGPAASRAIRTPPTATRAERTHQANPSKVELKLRELTRERAQRYARSMLRTVGTEWPATSADSQRREDTLQILHRVQAGTYPWDHQSALLQDGRVAALVTMFNDVEEKRGFIDDLVALPGPNRRGSAMLEAAVNQSVKWGHDGRLELFSLPRSFGFYLSAGFESACPVEGPCSNPMHLDVVGNPKWHQDANGDWRLKRTATAASNQSA